MNKYLILLAPLGLLIASQGCTPSPAAKFEASAVTQAAPVEIQFTNQSQNAERYEWDFGDGQTSVEESPAHTYQAFGNILIQLKAYQGELVSIDSVFIDIPEPPRRRAVIETAFGSMTVELSNRTPQHRDNFVKLVEQQYYDSLLFHRVMKQFMIQGGDPDSRTAVANQVLGQGGPGYTVPAEFVNDLVHTKGALAAARLPDQVNPEKASSGSQFYLVQGQQVTEQMLGQIEQVRRFQYSPEQKAAYLQAGFGTPSLDREYTVFGYVVEGIEVIDKITESQTDMNNRPLEDIRMKIHMIQ
ncbi:MAG: peptidylprolyl isomerase [Saprospirales bacterium]|nr:peptidylprolyl isomerase [Saprospirales bacterium]MBK8489907.1 peptidylprolyl isomerase [Saprospirales bacterium]